MNLSGSSKRGGGCILRVVTFLSKIRPPQTLALLCTHAVIPQCLFCHALLNSKWCCLHFRDNGHDYWNRENNFVQSNRWENIKCHIMMLYIVVSFNPSIVLVATWYRWGCLLVSPSFCTRWCFFSASCLTDDLSQTHHACLVF